MVAGTPEFAAVGAVPQFGATEDIGEPQACVMAEARTSRNRKGNRREFLMPASWAVGSQNTAQTLPWLHCDYTGAAVEGIELPSVSLSNGDLGQPMDLPDGAFFGKSIPACVKLYMSAAKKKKTIKEIAAALREGGVESTSDNFESVVTGALNRL